MLSERDRFEIYGTPEPAAEGRPVAAGPLQVTLEEGNLRTIRFMGHEVLRGIAFLVRDRDWGTCAPEISDMRVEEAESGFRITWRARFLAPSGAVLTCDAEIAGKAEGTLRFEARFSADRDFETARAGFTVLHPLAGLVGQPVEVRHGDGTVERAVWPERIEPWQPFMDIAVITHGVAPGISAETGFEGDVFEMEDQRNWTDGSFKTYVRPLALPWPYRVPAGEEIRQSVTLAITRAPGAAPLPASDRPVRLSLRETQIRLPAMGLGLRPECLEAELSVLPALRELAVSHLIAHFDPLAGHGSGALEGYARTARESGLPLTLELALPCREAPLKELKAIARLCEAAGLRPATLFVSPSVDRQSTPPGSRWPDCPPLDEVYAAARVAFPGLRLGGGMMSYFTELNRKRVPAGNLDYISHCTNPIVHAADDLSVMQSFEALGDVVRSVRAIYPDKPYRIGPSTIAMRQNPYGSATKDNPLLQRIPMANVDPRHNGRFGAAFAAAYAATVAPAGLEVLTLATLAGPFGLVAGGNEPSPEGTLRPLARVIGALGHLAGQKLVAVESERPDAVLGLATRNRLMLVNITGEHRTATIPASFGAASDVVLEPYDVLFLERNSDA
jgi:hypothetical protein